jgi:hypothetical protein
MFKFMKHEKVNRRDTIRLEIEMPVLTLRDMCMDKVLEHKIPANNLPVDIIIDLTTRGLCCVPLPKIVDADSYTHTECLSDAYDRCAWDATDAVQMAVKKTQVHFAHMKIACDIWTRGVRAKNQSAKK